MSKIQKNTNWYSITPAPQATKKANRTLDSINKALSIVDSTNEFIDNARIYTSITEITIENQHLIVSFANGLVFDCGVVSGDFPILRYTLKGIEAKYNREPDSAYKLLIPIKDISLTFDKLTPEQREEMKFHFSDFTQQEIVLLQKPATDAATRSDKVTQIAKDTITDMINLSELVYEEENNRKSNEEHRTSIEVNRVIAENKRVSQENIRLSQETSRSKAEELRVTDESQRASAERNRNDNETRRISSENERRESEKIRITEENTRDNSESIRKESEILRSANESMRESHEDKRIESEKNRKEKESLREIEEFNRISAETSRGQEEKLRNNSETLRNNNETSRISQEQHRVESERLREKSEASRIKAENDRIEAERERANEHVQIIEATNIAKDTALEVANHPNYIGADFYVYKWDLITKSYSKLDICLRPEAFNIFRVFSSILDMNSNKESVPEGKFVVINTGSVEEEDTGKLYVRTTDGFDYLVDLSGMRGFTGKTPQFIIGSIITTTSGTEATASLSEAGTDVNGNPIYCINISIPRGNPGGSFKVYECFESLDKLKTEIPDGSDIDGCCAIGTKAPYDYYFWSRDINGKTGWNDHGKLEGKKGDPYTWEDLTTDQKKAMAINTGNYLINHIFVNINGHLVFDSSITNEEDFGISLNYNDLKNKPSINGVILEGNKTTDNLGININKTQELANSNAKAINEIQETVSWYSI